MPVSDRERCESMRTGNVCDPAHPERSGVEQPVAAVLLRRGDDLQVAPAPEPSTA
ncbi:hypothetical protein AB0I68_31645 [Streptomyces sp. NPDC050448]|uniref:hypothetical protein n=1 Tax=Streptomyces sp. NPDC050448 TaxID=3155404 RepID=UPI00344226FA